MKQYASSGIQNPNPQSCILFILFPCINKHHSFLLSSNQNRESFFTTMGFIHSFIYSFIPNTHGYSRK